MSGRRAYALLLSSIAMFGCEGGVFVRGIVRDPAGLAVPRARVEIRGPEIARDQTPGPEGCFNVGGLAVPGRRDYDFTVSAPGYKSVAAKVRSLKDNILAVTLQPEGSAGESDVKLLREDPCEAQKDAAQ